MSSRRRLDLAKVKKLIAPLHAKALGMGFKRVSDPIEVGPDFPGIYYIPPGAKRHADVIPASEGWMFVATPGDGCESVRVGLCRFAGLQAWQLEGFCKTQYASNHGWEHFLKCHRGVIELLWAAESAGLKLKVRDEGGLWETGSHLVLKRNLEEYEGLTAAFVGAMKDADELSGEDEKSIEAPILSHPEFEKLEAHGMAAHKTKIRRAVLEVTQIASAVRLQE